MVGHLLVGISVFWGVLRRLKITHVCECVLKERSCFRLLSVGDSGYLGILVGLLQGFTSIVFLEDTHTDQVHAHQ